MNKEEKFKVKEIINIPREEINCANCKHYLERTCVPNGLGCQYDPIIPKRSAKLTQEQMRKIKDNVDLKTHYEIKPSFTTRKLKHLQQENKQIKDKLYKAERRNNELEQDGQDMARELGIRIDKAIEYIKNASYFDGSSMCANDLLEILGDKNEDIK